VDLSANHRNLHRRMFILDTNVLSELMRSDPAAAVTRWLANKPRRELYTTAVTEAEILYGIMLLAPGKRRSAFEAAAEAMFREDFQGRILSFGSEAAQAYARIAAERSRIGRPISHFDAQIAAIAKAANGTIVSRNIRDFSDCGVRMINPWESG